MLDRVRIRTLRDVGHTLAQIAATAGVGKSSVQRILKEPPLTSPESGPTPKSRGVGRPSQVEAFQDQVECILEEEPSLPTVEVLSRLRAVGYAGGKSAVYKLVKSVRPTKARPPEVRFEGVPGEFSQHDFGSVRVPYADGSSEKVHFFASRLKYARWTHVVTVPNEKVEPLIRALLAAFESFGGVPLRAVFDNPKTIVIEGLSHRDYLAILVAEEVAHRAETRIQPNFRTREPHSGLFSRLEQRGTAFLGVKTRFGSAEGRYSD